MKGVKNLHLDEIRTKGALKVRMSNQNCEVELRMMEIRWMK